MPEIPVPMMAILIGRSPGFEAVATWSLNPFFGEAEVAIGNFLHPAPVDAEVIVPVLERSESE